MASNLLLELCMKLNYCILLISSILSTLSFGQIKYSDLDKLKNDKEAIIQTISKHEKKQLLSKYKDQNFINSLSSFFTKSLFEHLNANDNQCEINLIKRFENKLAQNKIETEDGIIYEYLNLLRVHQQIDDIFLDLLRGITQDYYEFNAIDKYKAKDKKIAILFPAKKALEANNLENLFKNFKIFPDDSTKCTYKEFFDLKNAIVKVKKIKNEGEENEKVRISKKDHFSFLAKKAFNQNLITYTTYKKLIYLNNDSNIEERDLSLTNYFDIIFKAKNILRPKNSKSTIVDINKEDTFAAEKVKRFSDLTRRRVLFRKYDQTQIIALAQILQKSARRMNADPDVEAKRPVISQEFIIKGDNGQAEHYTETIELDPQSQYNLARRLLRKDMMELQKDALFAKSKITYEDVVMAALETGYTSLEEVEYVVTYDDLWNPNLTKFERVSGLIFKIAGYTTFFLPPPYNVVASIGLTVVSGIVDNLHKNGANNDNPATFIE